MDEAVCILCGEGDGGKSLQLLQTKGAATINTLAKTYQRPDIAATEGDHVHPQCWKAFGRHPNYKQRPETKSKSPAERRSLSPGYDSRRDCFYCSQPIKECEDNRGLISKASTISIVDGVKHAIIDRGNDRWAVEVQGRLDHVQCLLAKDCRYHRDCNANFRTSRAIPEKHRSTPNAKKPRSTGPKKMSVSKHLSWQSSIWRKAKMKPQWSVIFDQWWNLSWNPVAQNIPPSKQNI